MSIDSDILNVSNDSLANHDDDYELIPDIVQFWVYLVFLVPSIFCSLFVLYYLLWNRTLRRALHNHAIIIFLFIGLIYQVTIYPWMLYDYASDGIWERSRFFCTLWVFIDWGLYYTQTILFAWATIERHIIIFHHKWVLTNKQRLYVHYLPLIILVFYCLIYYTITTFFPSCENEYDSNYTMCVLLCAFRSSHALYRYDTIMHQILPNLVIVILSIALLIRVWYQKHRIGKSLQWRKHWKMTVQVLFVSILYLIFAFPVALMNFLYLCGLRETLADEFRDVLLFLNYCMMLLCPFACALSLPQLRNKLRSILRLPRPTGAIAPLVFVRGDTLQNEAHV